MKTRLILSAVIVVALSAQAHAQTGSDQSEPTWDFSGPEAGIQGGYAFGNSHGDEMCAPNICGQLPYSFHPDGAFGGIHAGYNWQPVDSWVFGFEGDIEGGGIHGDTHPPFGGAVYTIRTSMNADASVRTKLGWAFDNLLAYATGGVAFGNVNTNYSCPVCLGPNGNYADIEHIRVGWTAGAGLEYAFTYNWEAGIEYRYTDLGAAHHYSVAFDNQDHNEFNFSAVRMNLTYRFGEPPPPAPPLPPPPLPSPPLPPPVVDSFIVFFDFNKSNLTAEAQSVVAEAVKVAKSHGFVKVLVTGHTDTVGSDSYNMGLSVRRAESVKDEMVREGMDGSGISIQGKSFHDPLVPTGPGVREPQNRRAVIDLGG